jgi:FHA domain
MIWFVEHLHRDGTILARMRVPDLATAAENATGPVTGETGGSTRVFTIGRSLDNDLILDDPNCAPQHARLEINGNGTARLIDLGTQNKIIVGGRRRVEFLEIRSDDVFRLGQSQIRVRSSAWALPPERPLSQRLMWPLGLLGLALVLAHAVWEIWLSDIHVTTPAYLYRLSSTAAGICAWSAMYAIFGRLVSGVDRFFSHLAIAATGFLAGTFLLDFLELLAFASSWLWPIRITEPVVVIVAAFTVRAHLRLADPRHWRTLRVGIVIVASVAIVVPIAQLWISHRRLTNVQVHSAIFHPALRVAEPIGLSEFVSRANPLKGKVDAARKRNLDEDERGSNYEKFE